MIRRSLMYPAKPKVSILIALVPLLTASCTSHRLAKNLDKGYCTQIGEVNALMAQLDDDSVGKPIGWKEAWARMQRYNLSLVRSDEMLKEAKKTRTRAWRRLVPRVSGYMNLSSSLDDLFDFSSDNLSRSLSANFNIPNPFNFYSELYAAGLQYEDAKYAHELDRRKAYVTLYEAFLKAGELRERLERHSLELKTAEFNDAGNGADAVYQLQQEWFSLKRSWKAHRMNLNRLFNTPGGNWECIGRLPEVSFRNRYDKVEIGDDFGRLAMYLYAIRTEVAVLSKRRVKFRQWPTITFGLSQPPLYTSNRSVSYELEDFRLFSGASKSIDLTDPISLEVIQNAERRFAYTRQSLKQRMEREALRLIEMRNGYHQLLLKEQRLVQAQHMLGSQDPEQSEVVLVQLEAIRDIQEQLNTVREQILRIDLQYLVWDETYWK